jgi:hypothetical protein
MCLNGIQFRVTADTKFLQYWRLKWIRYQQLLSLICISMTGYRMKILCEDSSQRLCSTLTFLSFVQLVPETTCRSVKPITHINPVSQIPSPTGVFWFHTNKLLINTYIINTTLVAPYYSMFQPLKGHLQGVRLMHSHSEINKICTTCKFLEVKTYLQLRLQ